MKRAWIPPAVVAAAVIVVILIARARTEAPAAPGKLRVVASFYPLQYFASRIGGDKADVRNVTPAGAEPHDYEPTARDVARIEGSDLLILNGVGLEAWGDDIRKNLTRTAVVVAGEGLAGQRVSEGGKDVVDPHVWLSPALAERMVDKIVTGFIQADPSDGVYYQQNAAALKSDLDALDRDYRSGLMACARKEIVTSHAAFGYLAADYGFAQVPIAGLSPDADPSSKDLAGIAALVKSRGVSTIFFESLASPKLAQTLADETGAKALVLDPIEGLTAEDLAAGKDYFSEMRLDLDHLQTALKCTSQAR